MSRLVLPSALTQSSATPALRPLADALCAAEGPVELDASGLQKFDTVALACLLELARQAKSRGAAVSISGAPPQLIDLASLYGVSNVLGLSHPPLGN